MMGSDSARSPPCRFTYSGSDPNTKPFIPGQRSWDGSTYCHGTSPIDLDLGVVSRMARVGPRAGGCNLLGGIC